ncbi:MAG: hypothetical protein M0T72_04545 [Candidatus Dormibacteraeota bacterium]|nr:hypothetical protein [Candidatus Dormibacteraeota bacterium]
MGSQRAEGPAVELAAREERLRKSRQLTSISVHSLGWLVATYYATDFIPPLSIRLSVGLSAPTRLQFLVGYLALGAVALGLGSGFGWMYAGLIRRSRYPWRWVVFPTLVAVLLVPPQGADLLLTKVVVAAMAAIGILLGYGWRASRVRGRPGGREPARPGSAGGS